MTTRSSTGQFLPGAIPPDAPAGGSLAAAMSGAAEFSDPGVSPILPQGDLPPAPGPDPVPAPMPIPEPPPPAAAAPVVSHVAAPAAPPVVAAPVVAVPQAPPVVAAPVVAPPVTREALLAQAQSLLAQAELMPSAGPVVASAHLQFQPPVPQSAVISASQAAAGGVRRPYNALAHLHHDAEVTVVPLRDVPKVRIGPNWMCFRQGEPCTITVGVMQHLKEKRIVAG